MPGRARAWPKFVLLMHVCPSTSVVSTMVKRTANTNDLATPLSLVPRPIQMGLCMRLVKAGGQSFGAFANKMRQMGTTHVYLLSIRLHATRSVLYDYGVCMYLK